MNGKLLVWICVLTGQLQLFALQTASQDESGNEDLNNSDTNEKDSVSRQSTGNPGTNRNSRNLYNPVALRPGYQYAYPIAPNQYDARGYGLRPIVAPGRGYQTLPYDRPDVFGYSNFGNFPFTNFEEPFYQNDFFGVRQPGFTNVPYNNLYHQNPGYYDVRLYRPGINAYSPYANGRPIALNPNLNVPPYQQDHISGGGYPVVPPTGAINGIAQPPGGLTTGIAVQPDGYGVPIGQRYQPHDGVALQSTNGVSRPQGNNVGLQTNADGISEYVDRDANGVPYLVHPSARNRQVNHRGRTVTRPRLVPSNEQSQRNGYYRNYDNRNARPLPVGHSFLSPPAIRRPNVEERRVVNSADEDDIQRRAGVLEPEQPLDLYRLSYLESSINNEEVKPQFPVHPMPYAVVGDLNLDRRPNGDGYTTPTRLNPEQLDKLSKGRRRVVLRLRNRAYNSNPRS